MGKALSEMTKEELWNLFPIILSEHNAEWAEWYTDEYKLLYACPELHGTRISHIGSTAIGGIHAKPTVDILVEITDETDMEKMAQAIIALGYRRMSGEPPRVSFNKGYTEKGFAQRVFHLHLRYRGDNDELYFRDYMIDNPYKAREYEKLKLSLWKRFEHDRDGYTDAKTSFIRAATIDAKRLYGDRYL